MEQWMRHSNSTFTSQVCQIFSKIKNVVPKWYTLSFHTTRMSSMIICLICTQCETCHFSLDFWHLCNATPVTVQQFIPVITTKGRIFFMTTRVCVTRCYYPHYWVIDVWRPHIEFSTPPPPPRPCRNIDFQGVSFTPPPFPKPSPPLH